MTPDHDRSRGPGGRTGLAALLRGHRLAAGLTQSELAIRAGIGVRTVRDLERGRAARPQRTTAELLAGALGLTGAARTAFLAAARGRPANPPAAPAEVGSLPVTGAGTGVSSGPLPVSGPGPTTDPEHPDVPSPGLPPVALPPPAELVGREQDVADLVALLADAQPPAVLSLVGLAGVGKTALALAVAHRVVRSHPGGVAGVLVGEGSDAGDVLTAVAAVFGAARPAELAPRLAGRPALLVVDAVERAPDAVAEALHRLAHEVPALRVLATGRHPVGLPGERVRPVTPLDVPPLGVVPAGPVLQRYPAAALFVARLAQARREPLGAEELSGVAALVRRLGGLPLAIELMAARGRILDVNEMLDRYGDRVLDLAAPRPRAAAHRDGPREAVAVTLREAVATSYRLLAADERAALRRLSAFRNRWSVELAERMLAEDADRDGVDAVDPVPLLDRLLELGLLSVRGSGPYRFRLLDAVRDFATEQAVASGEAGGIRRRHAEIVADLAARTAPELAGGTLAGAVRRLDEVTGDISAALAYASIDDPHTALRLASALSRWWRFRGRDVAGRQWLRRLLDDPRTADADPVVRARARLGTARLAAEHGAGAEELPAARAALAEFRRGGDVGGEVDARSVLCALLIATGAHDEAREQAEAVLAVAVRHGRVRDMAVAQNNLTWHDIRVGDLAGARRRLAAVDRLAAQCGEQRLRVLARANLAEVARLEGRYADAVDQGRRVVAALPELGDPGHRRRVLGTIGLALAQDGRADEAAEVLAELRAAGPPVDSVGAAVARPEDGVCALIEGTLALHRGDRELASEWFGTAAEAAVDGQDRRDVVEALVGLAASTSAVAVLERLDRVRREGGISLLPQEEELLYALTAARRGAAGVARATQPPGVTPRSSLAPSPPGASPLRQH